MHAIVVMRRTITQPKGTWWRGETVARLLCITNKSIYIITPYLHGYYFPTHIGQHAQNVFCKSTILLKLIKLNHFIEANKQHIP